MEMDDEVEQNAAGVALFGTKWEEILEKMGSRH